MSKLRINNFVVVIVLALCFSVSFSGCGKKAEPPMKEVPAEDVKSTPVPSDKPITEERTFYDFETSLQGWEIPAWAESKSDYLAKSIVMSDEVASKGTKSLKMDVDFTGTAWNAGLAEIQQYLDISAYRVLSVDIFLPKEAPEGLKAKLIITVGNTWKFVEMNQDIPLIPGEWVTITASVEPGSYSWKRVVPDDEFARDIRKIAVRIVSNNKPAYTGPIYIDNVRVGR
ncbi:MAG: hypothetical protein HQL29_02070 [Candidatus Omnitrophica bacterium]|nr:hypothetical protein [Candidatus Omnitrophota bacterium]